MAELASGAARGASRPLAVWHPAVVLGSSGGRIGTVLLGVVLLAAVVAPYVVGAEPMISAGPPLAAPSTGHRLGTDDLGRDVLALVVHGMRTSLLVAGGVVVIAGAIGVAIGAIAGWYGRTVDDVLMRFTEMVQVVPRFFFAVVVMALFGPGLRNLILVLGVTSWTWTARVVRAEILSLRNREFVDAARVSGGSGIHILSRHVLPNVIGTTLVMLSVVASSAILLEAGLGFVGLTDPDVVSLGYLANNAQRFLRTAWWLTLFPGAALVVTILAINLIGDAIGDAADRSSVGRVRVSRPLEAAGPHPALAEHAGAASLGPSEGSRTDLV